LKDKINIETFFYELTLNPSLGKRGTFREPLRFSREGRRCPPEAGRFGDELF
jgi:hypothetical protein